MRKSYFYLVGIVLLGISFFLDKNVAAFFSHNRVAFLDAISIFIHSIETYFFFIFVLILLLVFRQKDKIIPLFLTFVFYLGATQLIKIVAGRPRPFTRFDFPSLDETGINRSFPSGHTAATASLIRFFEFRRFLLYGWIVVVVLVMFSRVYLGMHYLSDVIAGLLLGYFVSDVGLYLAEKVKKKI